MKRFAPVVLVACGTAAPAQVAPTTPVTIPRAAAAAEPKGAPHREILLALGGAHSCAARGSAVYCWGFNQVGQLGLGDTENRGEKPGQMGENLPAVDLGPGLSVIALAAGGAHTCAILATDPNARAGVVKCWGHNRDGQLGLGDTQKYGEKPGQMGKNLPIVDLGSKATAIALNTAHSCALLTNGVAKCWGDNFFGELSLGKGDSRGKKPEQMGKNLPALGAPDVRAIAAGGLQTCVIRGGGTVECGGVDDAVTQEITPAEPVHFPGGHAAKTLATGSVHSCAVLETGALYCWGFNHIGQLGLPAYVPQVLRKTVKNLPETDLGARGKRIAAIALGGGHGCVVLEAPQSLSTTIKCWGGNETGQLGLGDTENRGEKPGQMGENLPAVDLAL